MTPPPPWRTAPTRPRDMGGLLRMKGSVKVGLIGEVAPLLPIRIGWLGRACGMGRVGITEVFHTIVAIKAATEMVGCFLMFCTCLSAFVLVMKACECTDVLHVQLHYLDTLHSAPAYQHKYTQVKGFIFWFLAGQTRSRSRDNLENKKGR